MNLQMDSLNDPVRASPIQKGREMLMEPYSNQQFGIIDDPDCQSGSGMFLTPTRTRTDGPEPLLTLITRMQSV